MKLTGKIERRDLEGGILQLDADNGQRYTLEGAGREVNSAAGKRVELEGEVDEGAFGIAMAGPTLRVRAVRILER